MGYGPVICLKLILYHRFSHHNKTLRIFQMDTHVFNTIYQNKTNRSNDYSYMLVVQSIRPRAWLSLQNIP